MTEFSWVGVRIPVLLEVLALFMLAHKLCKVSISLQYFPLLASFQTHPFLENALVPGPHDIACLKPDKNYKVNSWAHLCVQVGVHALSWFVFCQLDTN